MADAFDGLVEVGALEVVADLVAGCVALLPPPDELLVAVPPEPSDEPPPPQAVSRKQDGREKRNRFEFKSGKPHGGALSRFFVSRHQSAS